MQHKSYTAFLSSFVAEKAAKGSAMTGQSAYTIR
jgi:hypothetical protein